MLLSGLRSIICLRQSGHGLEEVVYQDGAMKRPMLTRRRVQRDLLVHFSWRTFDHTLFPGTLESTGHAVEDSVIALALFYSYGGYLDKGNNVSSRLIENFLENTENRE